MAVKKIAVTGGIGSGKTSVCNYISRLGYPVFSCDEIYKKLLKDRDFKAGVYKSVGVEFDENLPFNAQLVASVVFNDKGKRRALESFTHPRIMQEMDSLMEQVDGIAFAEVPLLFEGGYESLYDGVIVVLRDEEERIRAVALRDGISVSDVKSRINNQINYENISHSAHTIICNDGSLPLLENKVRAVIDEISK